MNSLIHSSAHLFMLMILLPAAWSDYCSRRIPRAWMGAFLLSGLMGRYTFFAFDLRQSWLYLAYIFLFFLIGIPLFYTLRLGCGDLRLLGVLLAAMGWTQWQNLILAASAICLLWLLGGVRQPPFAMACLLGYPVLIFCGTAGLS